MNTLSDKAYAAAIASTDKPTVIKFFSTNCAPCRALAPAMVAVAEKLKDSAHFYEINIDAEDCWDSVVIGKIDVVPTILIYKGGSETARRTGTAKQADLEQWVTQNL